MPPWTFKAARWVWKWGFTSYDPIYGHWVGGIWWNMIIKFWKFGVDQPRSQLCLTLTCEHQWCHWPPWRVDISGFSEWAGPASPRLRAGALWPWRGVVATGDFAWTRGGRGNFANQTLLGSKWSTILGPQTTSRLWWYLCDQIEKVDPSSTCFRLHSCLKWWLSTCV